MAAESIGEMPRFAAKSAFWAELRAVAKEHLAREAGRGRPSIGDPRLLRKAAVILLWFSLSYAALLSASTLPAALLAALSLAFAAAAIGFGVFHDANHRTLFKRPAANLFAARLGAALLGLSRHFWVHKHQSLHHRQPNVVGWDDDLETRGFLRLSPASAWEPRHRRQEVKALLWYGLNSLEWVFWKDFHCLALGRLNAWHPLELEKHERRELLVCKGLYLILFVVLPFVVLPFLWAAAALVLYHLAFSWVLAAVFQVAHLTPEMEFDGVRAGDDWAMHQLRTTADFATGSRFTTWFTGGLNHQIEHHLFPNVAHSHYSGLRPIVRAVAGRHGLRCHDLGGTFAAIRQHFTLLKTLGARAEPLPS
ncbi:MAG: Linoleoyl-CoA desaturase [uncultured Sphingomonas sp.]|uniref:Linoleoyl-CoA desaturase n=1 Tax=uncultured Sphingomonas sp. TaxID=158754 RepID=A0A6J4SSZ5_9SPHN|nr:MAG: Linoleoyl-CoA desaturase [uncultured Sphingomonas sp.]